MTEETNGVSKALNDALAANLQTVMVCGFDQNGQVFMSTSNASIPMMHWILNRSVFELGLFEKQDKEKAKEAAE